MDILLIGGSGFLSGTIARRAVADGHRVWAVTRGKRELPAGVTSIIADRADRTGFAEAITDANTKWDLAVDCIAFTGDDARQILSALAGLAAHLVLISTDFVVSPIDRPWRVDETYARFDDSPYGQGKRGAEEVLLASNTLPFTILRPGHIYGPGSLLGCLPTHGRDPQLLDRLRRGEPMRLVGGGHFLQAPVFAADLWETVKSCVGNRKAMSQIYFAPGPNVIESREYYHIIADTIGVKAVIEEIAITEHLRANPGHRSFCCHRVYATDKGTRDGLVMPNTPVIEGLRQHLQSL